MLQSGITVPSYIDNTAEIYPGIDYNYKVTYVTSSGEESPLAAANVENIYANAPDGLGGRMYWVLLEQVRRQSWALRVFEETVKLFIKRRIGQRCQECYDPITDKAVNPRCTICFGTGIVGGYERFQSWLLFSPTDMTIRETVAGPVKVHVYSGDGELVRTVFTGTLGAGNQTVEWNLTDGAG